MFGKSGDQSKFITSSNNTGSNNKSYGNGQLD